MGRLVKDVADRAQQHTQRSWKRPYGAGLLIAGCDKTGAHLFYNCPSGAYYDYKAMAIGARSQVNIHLKRPSESCKDVVMALAGSIYGQCKGIASGARSASGRAAVCQRRLWQVLIRPVCLECF